MAELTFIILYLVCAAWEVLMMCVNKQYYGDAELAQYNITNAQAIFYFILYLLIWLIAYQIYRNKIKGRIRGSGVRLLVDEKTIKSVLTFWLAAYIAFTGITGVGVAGGNASSPYSAIFSMLDVTVFFPFYYVLFRNGKYRKAFWINTGLFCLLQIMQGWSGFLLTLFLYEFYFWEKRNHKKKNIPMCILLTVACLAVGGILYSIMQPLKMSIRFGYSFNRNMVLDFEDALTMLIQRISPFCRSTYALYNMPDIKRWYWVDPRALKEVMCYIKPVMPSFLMPDKNIMSLSESVFASILHSGFPGASSGNGFIVYAILLFYCDWCSGILWVFFFLSYLFIMRKLFAAFETRRGQMDILFFGMILRILGTGSLEVLFFQKEMKLLFILPVLYLLGAIRLSKNKQVNMLRRMGFIE